MILCLAVAHASVFKTSNPGFFIIIIIILSVREAFFVSFVSF